MASRVLYVINGFMRGGAEQGLLTILDNGFMKDADFRVFAFMKGNGTLYDALCDRIGADRVTLVSNAPKLTLPSLLIGTLRLFGVVMSWRPKVAILSLKQSNIAGRFVLGFFPGIWCVGFEHIAQLEAGKLKNVYEGLLKRLSGRVNEVWADCESTLVETRAYYTPKPGRVETVIPLFIRPANVRTKSDYTLGSPVRLLAVGRLIARKRYDLVLEAMARQIEKGHDLSLSIFGEGPEQGRLEALAAELGLGDRVLFKGFVKDWWGNAADYDLFVNPSDEEGFCIVAAEALMTGLPSVCTPVGGLKDYLVPEQNGLVMARGDLDGLEQGLARLLQDATLRERLGTTAARDMARIYSEAAMRERLATVSRRLCGVAEAVHHVRQAAPDALARLD
ncbi:glycosyltransferase [Asticcacaulis solisilvae]|uniref:glycosyltransferase n=1 Tax=Asticcacaulis solisilvae TaxID=1217274 RepID=UPI003FD75B35